MFSFLFDPLLCDIWQLKKKKFNYPGMWMEKPTWRMLQTHWRKPKRRSSLQTGGMYSLFILLEENMFRQTDSLGPTHTICWANVAILDWTDCFNEQNSVLIISQSHCVYIFLGNQPINSLCSCVWLEKAHDILYSTWICLRGRHWQSMLI